MSKFDTAIFDVDGTLFNTKPGIVACIKATIEKCGLRPLGEEEFDQFIGPPIHETFARVYGLTPEEGLKVAQEYRAHYGEDGYLLNASFYEGMEEALKILKEGGVKIGVATYKMENMALHICESFGVHDYAASIHGTDRLSTIKKPEIIKMVMKDLGSTDPEKTVMIGDTVFDVTGAEGAGCRFLGVTFGFGFKTEEEVMAYPISIGAAATPLEITKYFV